MFTQSLTHGSDEAQKEIQKLTEFLEREHKLGVIPVDLEKKVIRKLKLSIRIECIAWTRAKWILTITIIVQMFFCKLYPTL